MGVWYNITTESGLQRTSQLLQELNIKQPVDPHFYIRLGYKQLSAQTKETFYLIHSISKLNKNSVCKAGTDYLSLALGTNEKTQLYRLKQLQKFKLIKIVPNNTYHMIEPIYPDSTFVSTIINIIRRKYLGSLISYYLKCNNPILRMNYLLEIKKLQKKGVYHNQLPPFLNGMKIS